MRGADRESSRTRGGMRWTRALARDERERTRTVKPCGPGARSWRQALRMSSAKRRWQKSSAHRGEREISRKTTAQGKPDALRWTCILVCAPLCKFCTRDRGCSAHPAFPAPSCFRGGQTICKTSGASRRENAEVCYDGTTSQRHCERSEAIQLPSLPRKLDCFVASAPRNDEVARPRIAHRPRSPPRLTPRTACCTAT
jgi:hypothetical protein